MFQHPSNKITLTNMIEVTRFTRTKLNPNQSARHEALALACEDFIRTILTACPDCADRSSAIRHVRMAKMEASASIALEKNEDDTNV